MTTSDITTFLPSRVQEGPSQLLLGGRWVDTDSHFDVSDPATGKLLATVSDAGPEHASAALDAATTAALDWARTPSRARADILMDAHRLVLDRTEMFARVMTLEMGRPLRESEGEVRYAAEFLRWFAEEAVRSGGDYRPAPAGGGRILTTTRPVGTCLLITPWNFPLAMGTRKLGPALAAGCTCIIKPAPQTPLTMLLLGEVLTEVGVPSGVVNILPTSRAPEVVAPLLHSPHVRKLSFTGSTDVGRVLLSQCADTVKRVSLELGGNAPFLVFGDADLEQAVDGAILAKMRNTGAACVAANRFLVAESVAPTFVELFSERMASLRVGPGLDESSQVGPLIDAASRDRIAARVSDALSGGARLATGGYALEGPGYFYAPTVVDDVSPQDQLCCSEIFGPVAPVIRFRTEDEAVALANRTEAGLAAYAYTGSLERALRLGDRLDVGMLGINRGLISDPAAPFGGAKQSGLGREGGREGLLEYQEVTYVALPA